MSKPVVQAAELPQWVGKEIGVSEWQTITQEDVNAFADVTRDHQWVHVDVERATKESPFGGPMAHGYLTLSLLSYHIEQLWEVQGCTFALNYGLNKVRFPNPVLVGKAIRCRATLEEVTEVAGGFQCQLKAAIEVEDADKPACVAEVLFRFYL